MYFGSAQAGNISYIYFANRFSHILVDIYGIALGTVLMPHISKAIIKKDFELALKGIKKLPNSSKLGVYTAYKYYLKLLHKLEKTPSLKIKSTRIRIPNYQKINLLLYSYFKHQFKFI